MSKPRKNEEHQIQAAIMDYLDGALPEYRHDAEQLTARMTVDANGCWNWGGARVRGYGYKWFSVRKQPLNTHRIALMCIGIEIEGMVVCHRCDNPSCFNPEHLFVGTPADNVADCIAKGRKTPPPVTDWPSVMKERKHHWQKLTAEQVLEIRRARSKGVPCKVLAEKYGVTDKHISRVAVGKERWGHL